MTNVFKTGWKGKTRDGRDAEVIKDNLKVDGDVHLVVVYTERKGRQWVSTISSNGRRHEPADSPYDLIDEPEYLEGWVNVYPAGGGSWAVGVVHKTKEDAEDAARGSMRHSCIHIRWAYRKGDGLEEK